MRTHALIVLALITAISLSVPAEAKSKNGTTRPAKRDAVKKAAPLDTAASFEEFCKEWMQKLAARERDNIKHIKWETKPDQIEGTYVGYEPEHTCTLADQDHSVGKIHYREIRYAKRGATISDAEQSTPSPVEIDETTEIFRYVKGKWTY